MSNRSDFFDKGRVRTIIEHHDNKFVNSDYKRELSSRFLLVTIGILVLILVCISFIKKANGLDALSFRSFLTWLGSVNSMPIRVNISDYSIVADWGLLNGLRDFFNIFSTLFGVLVYCCANLINLLIFMSQFLVFIFSQFQGLRDIS